MPHESLTNLSQAKEKSKKPEKSQEELRGILEKKLKSMEFPIKKEMKNYANCLSDEIFEDQEGEEEGSGERRKLEMQNKLNDMIDRAEITKVKLDSKELLPQFTEDIEVKYSQETITFNLEEKMEEFVLFYKKTKLDFPPDFEEQIKEIWENNILEIEKAIQENGFNDILLVPGNLSLPDLNAKMTEGYKNKTWESDNFKSGGSFASTKSDKGDKPRIVLVHNTKELNDRPELGKTLNNQGQDVKMNNTLTMEDYWVFQRKYFEENQKHLDEKNYVWLATKSGARLVSALWNPDDERVNVSAADLAFQHEFLGFRPSRSFY